MKQKTFSTTKDVLNVFWQHLRSHKWSFVALVFVSAGVSILEDVLSPWAGKKFVDVLAQFATTRGEEAYPIIVKALIFIFAIRIAAWIGNRIGAIFGITLCSRVMADLE